MSGIYSTNKIKNLNQLNDVNITDLSNNDIIQYNASSSLWENKSDFTIDEIDCRVLRVSETADIGGRLACVGVASLVNDEFVFQNGISILGQVLYLNNTENRIGINKSIPEHALDVVGNIRLGATDAERLIFNNTTIGVDIADNDAILDGTNGGIWGVRTKVDGGGLTEKIRINNLGAIGIGGANYGTAGSILTSQGSGASPTWNEPYRLRIYKNTDQTIPDAVATKIVDWVVDTDITTTQGTTDFNTTTDIWSPSISGVYYISGQVYVSPQSGQEVLRVIFRIKDTAGNRIRQGEYTSDFSDQGVYQMSVNFTDMLYIDGSTDYEFDVFVDRISGTTRLIGLDFVTWFSAFKIG